MALNAALPRSQATAKGFVNFLVSRSVINPGFKQILGGKDLNEIGSYLLSKRLVDQISLTQLYAQYLELPMVRLTNRPILPDVVRLIPKEVSEKYRVLAYDLQSGNLYVAISRPDLLQENAPQAIIKLRQQKGLKIHLMVAPESDLRAVLHKIYTPQSSHVPAKPTEPSAHNLAQLEQQRALITGQKSGQPNSAKPATDSNLVKKIEHKAKPVDLKPLKISQEVLSKIPYAVAKKYQLIVFGYEAPKSQFEPSLIKVAVTDPNDLHVREILTYIEQRNKVLVDEYLTDLKSFKSAIKQYQEATDDNEVELLDQPTEAVVEIPQVDLKAKPAAPAPPPPPLPELKEEKPQQLPTIHLEKKDEPKNDIKPVAPPAVETKPTAPRVEVSTDASEGIVVLASEITSRPAQESAEELQRLAREQRTALDNQNLDQLLRGPVLSVEELAKYFKSGIIPEMVAATLFLAIRMKASDVHIEAGQDTVRLRFRVDGILHDILMLPGFLQAPLVSRIKILSKMKIDEQRVPQDGRFDVIIDNRQVDLRVSTLPTVHGEKVVMRLLDKSAALLSLEQMGITGSNFDVLVANIKKPYGIILSTGPTGSGKSTTLYAILKRISKPGVNIITLEDPVEYELPGINQAQVKPQIGFTFAEGLRSVLRQDPNIIMVGEIRDLETASMATHAALTGHLVLSTLHTNDAAGALPRLINMGVEPFLITSSINAVIGQRLVRRICENCRMKAEIPTAVLNYAQRQLSALPSGQLKNINLDELTFYKGGGCPQCTNGYKGRIGIFEVLPMNHQIEELAVKKVPASEIKKAAIHAGMVTMAQDGLLKALKGITTIDEVMRVTTAQVSEIPDA